MNKAQNRPTLHKVLSMILALVMVLSLLPMSGFSSDAQPASASSSDSTEFMRIFHLDCGRKYFTVDQIKGLIDTAAENNYTHVELAFGNNGLRFLLDDMSVKVDGTEYTSQQVSEGIHSGNEAYCDFDTDELTEAEMDAIIDYAKTKDIEIIPLLNSPGHMDAIIDCMEELGMNSVAFSASGYGTSARTIDLNNTQAVAFTKALVQKYVTYFQGKGCQYFNIGADEYANDILLNYSGMGFGYLINKSLYSKFVSYVNELAGVVTNADMTPMAFNDGIYYNSNESCGAFNTSIVICYWSCGWGQYIPAPASFLASKGHKIINTNDGWYYVLGRTSSGTYNLSSAKTNVASTSVTNVPCQTKDTAFTEPVGCMLCLWCDEPSASYSSSEVSNVKSLISTLASSNSAYFKSSSTTDPDPEQSTAPDAEETVVEVEVAVGSTATSTQNGVDSAADVTQGDNDIATVTAEYKSVAGETTKTLGSKITSFDKSATGVISDGNGNYMVISNNGAISSTTDINAATEFTVTKSSNSYTIYGNGYYLYVSDSNGGGGGGSRTLKTSSSGTGFKYNSSKGFYYQGTNNSYYITPSSNSWTVSKRDVSSYANLYAVSKTTTESVKGTVITFTGVAAGTTEIKVGNVLYKITVTDKAPDNAMTSSSIKLEYWITNYKVYDGTSQYSNNQYQTINSTTSGATSTEGIDIAEIAPNPAYSFFDGTKTVYYWQAMRLDSDNQQTTTADDDETADGTTLTHIRYHGGAWQYKTAANGTWQYFLSTDQLVAYYLQKTEVTTEIDTYMKDWGYETTGNKITSDGSLGSVALTVAVVYPDGTVSPTEDEMYANSTTIFNYKAGRDIGIVAPVNNSDYNISKITVTSGNRDRASVSSGTDNWYGTSNSSPDTITWDKTTNADGSKWYDETVVWDKVKNAGTTPMVNGKTSNITWSAKNTAKLVLIYLEPIEKETNLNVVWYDDNANTQISRTQVAMKYTDGDAEPTFTQKLMYKGEVIGDNSPWNGKTSDDADYLPDAAYVTNSSNVDQTFNKNLGTIPNISGIYTSGLYEYVGADVSEDGKTLTLHYNLKDSTENVYVVDFGLPVVIPVSAFGIEDFDSVSTISFDQNDKSMTERDGTYGHGSINTDTGAVTYTLTKPLDTKVPIPVYFTFNNSSSGVTVKSVQIIPASTVYYEDSFASFKSGTANKTQVAWQILNDNNQKISEDDVDTTSTQALEELGKKTNVYGYDDAYKSSTLYSLGSAHKVTVSAAMASASDIVWPSATFTFKGTGFDIISLTDSDTGTILYTVTNKDTGEKVCSHILNTYYGYTYEDGEWKVDTEATGIMYQVPVIKISGLEYANYEVEISVRYGKYFDSTGDDSYSFWLDGIRVYDPMGKNANYDVDGETSPSYVEIREVILDAEALVTEGAKTGAVFIDGKGSDVTADDYANYGPNHEAYLAKSQAIAFQLVASAKPTSVQLGAKLANGKAGALTITGASCDKATNGVLSLNTSTDMYYALTNLNWTEQDGTYISNVITLTNNSSSTDSIISLTNLKFIGATYTSAIPEVENAANEAALISLAASPAMVNEAVLAVSSVLAAEPTPDPEPSTEPDPEPSTEPEPDPEPEVKTFEPETFKVSLSKDSIRKGQEATLTVKASAEVTAITVNGNTCDEYKIRFERSGWKWWSADRTEYHVFTVTLKPDETTDYEVIAVNAEGAVSEAETVTLTVKAAQSNWWGDMWNSFFGKWF